MRDYSNLDENGQPVPPITGTGPIRDVLGPVRAYLENSSGPVPDELFALLDTFLEIDKELTGKPLPLNVDDVGEQSRGGGESVIPGSGGAA